MRQNCERTVSIPAIARTLLLLLLVANSIGMFCAGCACRVSSASDGWFATNRVRNGTFDLWPDNNWAVLGFSNNAWRDASASEQDVRASLSEARGAVLAMNRTNTMLRYRILGIPSDLAGTTVVARIDGHAARGQSLTLRVRSAGLGGGDPTMIGQPVRHHEDDAWHTLTLVAAVPQHGPLESIDFEVFRSGPSTGAVQLDNASLEFYMEKPVVRATQPTARDMWIAGAALALFMVGSTLLFRQVWTTHGKCRSACINTSLLLGSLALTLLLLELVFRHLYVQTDRFGAMWVSRHWFREHWTPINADGFRDIDHPNERLSSKKVLYIVGDSFAAGHGIRDANDRFANIIARELGDAWETVVLAKNGWSTADQLTAVKARSVKPNAIMLSYVFNDIEGAARASGKLSDLSNMHPGPWSQALIDRSYFADFVYWRTVGIRSSGTALDGERDNWYRDAEVWRRHER